MSEGEFILRHYCGVCDKDRGGSYCQRRCPWWERLMDLLELCE